MTLLLPAIDVGLATLVGRAGEIDKIAPHGVHFGLALDVEAGVVGLTSRSDGGDEGYGEALFPGAVDSRDLIYFGSLAGVFTGAQGVKGGVQLTFGFVVGCKEEVVAGGLVAAKSGLLVNDEAFYEKNLGDVRVRGLDLRDGFIGPVNLPGDAQCPDQHG